jgi:hypothetical protein
MGPQQSDVPMFRTDIAPENSFLSWVIQQIAAPIPLVLWALLVNPVESAIAPWLQVSRDMFDLFLYLAIAVQRIFPGAVWSVWRIWIVPVALLFFGLCWNVAHFSLSSTLKELFYPGPGGEAQVVFVLMTCPTVSAVAYSLGMIYATHRQASRP